MQRLAVLFDLDGVISDTASAHAMAWKAIFEEFLGQNYLSSPAIFEPSDYISYLDGKARITGIKSFLESRNITLSTGQPEDEGLDTIHGIGNAKNAFFNDILSRCGVHIFEDAIRLIDSLQELGLKLGLASASKNAKKILGQGGLKDCFQSIMDGIVAEKYDIKSKPHPDFYLYAAKILGYEPQNCIVLEDAISGVISAREAGIKTVIGIARQSDGVELRENGADVIVSSLDELDFEIFSVKMN